MNRFRRLPSLGGSGLKFSALENFTLNFSNHWNFRVFAFPMLGNFCGGDAGGGAGGGGECGELRGAAGEVRAIRHSGE